MSDVARAIQNIEAVAEELGLAEFAREADVPYTTAADWKSRGWRPKWVVTLEKFAAAADRRRAPEASPTQDAAA
jgi:hypothetical protein